MSRLFIIFKIRHSRKTW